MRLLLLAVLLAAGCASGTPASNDSPADGAITLDATVRYVDLEGGFYGLVTTEDERLLPQSLPEDAQVDGLEVRVTGRYDDDRMTIQQWGRPFFVTRVERR